MTTSPQNLLPYPNNSKNAHAITLHGQTFCIRRRADASVGSRNMRFRSFACEHAMPGNRMYNAIGPLVLSIGLSVICLFIRFRENVRPLVGLCVVDTKAFYMSFLSFPVEKTNGKIKIS